MGRKTAHKAVFFFGFFFCASCYKANELSADYPFPTVCVVCMCVVCMCVVCMCVVCMCVVCMCVFALLCVLEIRFFLIHQSCFHCNSCVGRNCYKYVFLSYYNSQLVCLYVQTFTPAKPLERSLQNFQELIRAPHCTSSLKFHSDWVAMGVVLSMGVV